MWVVVEYLPLMKNCENSNQTISSTYKRLFKYVKPYRGRLAIGIISSIIFGGSTGAVIPAIQKVTAPFESMQVSEVELHILISAAFLVFVITAVRAVGFFLSKYYIQWVGSRVVMDVRNEMFKHMHQLPMQFFSKSRSGELITRLTSDTALIQSMVSNVIGELLREPATLIGAIIGLFWTVDWQLALVVLVVFPVCLLPVSILGRRVRKASKRGQEKTANLLSQAQESIAGAQIVKAFCMEDEEFNQFAKHGFDVFKQNMKVERAQAIITPLMEVFSAVGMMIVLVFAFMKDLKLSDLFAFIVALVIMYKPAKSISKLYLKLQHGMIGATRVFEVLDTDVSIDDKDGAIELSPQINEVKFSDVGFSYDNEPILRDVNLTINAGECIAFVGSSGAGKTTLVNLLPRFFDVKNGAISINGQNIKNYALKSLRKQIGIVTQQTILFNQSIADNISYGQSEATLDAIMNAARRANAHDFIVKLEDGYETVIGERGSRISGGQAQRLAIARALLKNPPILILDEATSALDTESERLVQQALDELMNGRTVLVIAHRLSTVRHADKIVVMDKGQIIEVGTHDELLERGGKYKHLYDIQFRDNQSA